MAIKVNLKRLYSFDQIITTPGTFTPLETTSIVVDENGFSEPKRLLGSELKTWIQQLAAALDAPIIADVDSNTEQIEFLKGIGSYATYTDPATDTISVNDIDTKIGAAITLTTTGNTQTLPNPTDETRYNVFTVINNDTSTDSISISGAVNKVILPGEKVEFIWDGTAWVSSSASGLWYDSGTSLLMQTARNLDLQDKGLKDVNVTVAVKLGDATNTAFTTDNKTIIGSVNELQNLNVLTKEPTGFTDPENVIVTYDDITSKVTVTGTVLGLYQGHIVSELVSGWESPALTDTYPTPSGGHFLYYNGSGFFWSTTPWTYDYIQIAYVYYRDTGEFIFALRECHGATMSYVDHLHGHQTTGTYKVSGGTLSNYVLASTTAADRRPDNDPVVIRDEDVKTSHPLRLGADYTHAFLELADTIKSDWLNAEIVKVSGNQPYWNEFTGGVWQQTLMTNNSYMSLWIASFPSTADAKSQRYNFFSIQGQSEGTLAQQKQLSPLDVNLGALENISPEFVFLNQIIIKYASGNWTIEEVVNLSGSRALVVGGASGNYLSSVISDDTLNGLGTIEDPLRVNSALFKNITDTTAKVFSLTTPLLDTITPETIVEVNLGAAANYANQDLLLVKFYETDAVDAVLLNLAPSGTLARIYPRGTNYPILPATVNGISINSYDNRGGVGFAYNGMIIAPNKGDSYRLAAGAEFSAGERTWDNNNKSVIAFKASDEDFYDTVSETMIGVDGSGDGFLGVSRLCLLNVWFETVGTDFVAKFNFKRHFNLDVTTQKTVKLQVIA